MNHETYVNPGPRFMYIFELYKQLVVRGSPELIEYAKELNGSYRFMEIIGAFFFGYKEWLTIIPLLNHKRALNVVEIYRAVLRYLLKDINIRPEGNDWIGKFSSWKNSKR